MATATSVQKNLQAAMREALRIQDRFVPEPLFAKTGRGYLKSEGVATRQRIKASLPDRNAACHVATTGLHSGHEQNRHHSHPH